MIAEPESIEYPIDTAGTEAQVVVLATRLKGELNDAPAEGAATVIADAGTIDPAIVTMAKSKAFMESPRI
jgi:hypothetical protein